MVKTLNSLCQMMGNTWIYESDLRNYWRKSTGNQSLSVLNDLIKQKEVFVADKNGKTVITISDFYYKEIFIANEIFRIKSYPVKQYEDRVIDPIIDRIERRKGLKLDIGQRDAVKCAVNNSFMILTGGPGTGKTCVLNVINDVLYELDPQMAILYAAPTGKAAKRITESTGFAASTIHSLLRITADNMEPTELNPIFKVLICDEISMLDIATAYAMLKAVPTGFRLYLVGDTDQLPSVGPGAILRDLVNSEAVPVSRLTKTFRQAGDSILFDNIQKIKHGDGHLKSGNDFKIAVPVSSLSKQDLFLYLYRKEVSEWGVNNVMCLTPYRKQGDTCSDILNKKIQAMVNPTGNCLDYYQTIFRKNDIIMQLKNREEVVNGDVGKIVQIYKNGLVCRFDNCEVTYGRDDLSQLTLSYAMSIHKSQGSESKSVVTCLLEEHEAMHQRNLLYTAVTRAKMNCTLLTEISALKKSVENEASGKRVTMLEERLRQLKKKEEMKNGNY